MQIQATSKKNKKQKTMPTIHNRYEFIKQAPKINCFPLQDCRSDPAEDQSRMRADVSLLHKTLTSKWNPEPISFQQSVTTPSTYHVTRHFSWKDTSVCVSVLLFVFFSFPQCSLPPQCLSDYVLKRCKDSEWQFYLRCCLQILGHFLQIYDARMAPGTKTGEKWLYGHGGVQDS